MRKLFITVFCLFSAFNLSACGGDDEPTTPPGDESGEDKGDKSDNDNPGSESDDKTFVYGADISWYSEMAADGKKFYNANGQERTCPALMKELGVDAVRLRVWVNPENKYCSYSDKADVVAKAKECAAQGLDIMIDFHYSDWWADPQRQEKPQAWASLSFDDLKTAVSNHTADVLTALKDEGITPKWVQVGNETRNGMLWSLGRLWTDNGDIENGWNNYATLSNAGYDAVKQVYPNATVIVHLNHAYEDNVWWFTKFKNAGGKFDMIGLSHYPQADDSSQSWSALNQQASTNVSKLINTFNTKVMITEVGAYQSDVTTGAKVISDVMRRMKAISGVAGVFYWEPEVDGEWKSASYDQLGWGAYTQGAFTTAGKPSAIFDEFLKK